MTPERLFALAYLVALMVCATGAGWVLAQDAPGLSLAARWCLQ